jgi:hypothetical protein
MVHTLVLSHSICSVIWTNKLIAMNFRQDDDFGRFQRVSGRVEGRRVTYKKLTGKLRGKENAKDSEVQR